MQITETAIAQPTVSDGPPILRVTFQGQGGDLAIVIDGQEAKAASEADGASARSDAS